MKIVDAVSDLISRIRKENTLASYQDTLEPFGEIFGNREPSGILPSEIRDYLRSMPVSDATKFLRLSHLRVLFSDTLRGLRINGECPVWSNPCDLLKEDFPKPKFTPKTVSDTIHEDMNKVRGSLREKHQLIFDLGTRGALRVSEILHITPGDLITSGECCAVRIDAPKSGHNQRYRVLPPDLCASLWVYIWDRKIAATDRIFPVTRQAVYQVFKARGVEPHDLRRYAAFRAVEMGLDLNTIKGLLGHANITTTAKYIGELSTKKLAESLKGM